MNSTALVVSTLTILSRAGIAAVVTSPKSQRSMIYSTSKRFDLTAGLLLFSSSSHILSVCGLHYERTLLLFGTVRLMKRRPRMPSMFQALSNHLAEHRKGGFSDMAVCRIHLAKLLPGAKRFVIRNFTSVFWGSR